MLQNNNIHTDYSNSYAFYVAIGRLISMVCGFVVPVYLSRALTVHDYGLYSQFFVLEQFLGAILILGIPSCIYYFYPKVQGNRRSFLLNIFALMTLTSLIGLFFINIPFVGERLFNSNELFLYVHVISIYLLFYLPNRLLEPLFVVRRSKVISVIIPPVETLLRVLFIIVAYNIWGTIEAIFFALAALQLLVCVFLVIYAFGFEPNEGNLNFSFSLAKEQLQYALPFGFAVILNSVCLYFDRILCIASVSVEDYAIYGIAFFSIPGIQQIYDSLSMVNLTNMSKAFHLGNNRLIIRLYNDFVRQVMSFTIPVVLIVCLFADDIIVFFYTDKYLDSTPFFRIYVLSMIFAFLGSGTLLRAIGKTKYTLIANIISAVIYLPAAFFLVKYYGVWGAMFSYLIGSLLPRIIKIFYEITLMNTSLRHYFPVRQIAIISILSILVLIPMAFAKFLLLPNFWFCILLGCIYVLVVFVLEIKIGVFVLSYDNLVFKYKSLKLQIVHIIRK